MNKLIFLIGVPGSGKTTFSQKLEKKGYKVHSSDAIRKELFGDENEKSNPKDVFNLLHKRIFKDINEGKNIVYDACNTSIKLRKKFLNKLKKQNQKLDIIAVLFTVAKEDCIIRDKNRNRTVGVKVIERMYNQLKNGPPTIEEGFSEILTEKEFLKKYE